MDNGALAEFICARIDDEQRAHERELTSAAGVGRVAAEAAMRAFSSGNATLPWAATQE